MTDNKLTDEEIIKALECCSNYNDCDKCNFEPKDNKKKTIGCCLEIMKNAIDLITRQQAEIERLKRELNLVCENSITVRLPHCVLCGNNVAVLTQDLKGYDEFIADVSAEAVKEFAERLKIYVKK